MKRILTMMVILFAAATGARSQDSLSVCAGGQVFGLPQFAYFNDQLPCTLYVKNLSPNIFSDSIYFTTAVDSTPFDTTSNFTANVVSFAGVNLLPGDSAPILLTELVSPFRYRAGGNIVVIWPAASNAIFVNTSNVYYIDVLGFNGMSEHEEGGVKVFPIPFGTILNIHSPHPLRTPEHISISDLSGKILRNADIEKGEAKIEELPAGFYLAHIRFSDGTYSTVRLVKARE